jgi:hypothetical protein
VVNRDWGHLDEAVAAFERALEIDPKYSKALQTKTRIGSVEAGVNT